VRATLLSSSRHSIAANPTRVGPPGAKAPRLRPAATPGLAHKPVSCQLIYTMMN
jgi:hypothetical protein